MEDKIISIKIKEVLQAQVEYLKGKWGMENDTEVIRRCIFETYQNNTNK